MTHESRRSERGFSLIEVLIAVAIIAVMGALVGPKLFPHLFKAKRTRAETDIATLKQAVFDFKLAESRLPRDSEFPRVFIEGSKNHPDSYIDTDSVEDGQILDPWGNPYKYITQPGGNYEIISYGADGAPGGEGDDRDISSKKSKNKNQ